MTKTLHKGVIVADAAYTRSEFITRTGLGEAGYRRLKQTGFPVKRQGRTDFILGRDWLNYLANDAKDAPPLARQTVASCT